MCLPCRAELPYCFDFEQEYNVVSNHFFGRIPVRRAGALLDLYSGSKIEDMLHRLKYQGYKDIGTYLGQMLGKKIKKHGFDQGIDYLAYVPLHPDKEQWRGYNQCFYIAQGISHETGVPLLSHQAVKLLHNNSQTKKNRSQRLDNVEDIYHIEKPTVVRGRHIILIDDVVTTGATLEACGKSFLDAGVGSISIFTIAAARMF